MPPGHKNPRKKGPKHQRANIKLTTLNINGCHIQGEVQTSFEKWAEVNATIKREKIAIMALQEMHLDQNHMNTIQQVFPKRLEIYNSKLEHTPRSSCRKWANRIAAARGIPCTALRPLGCTYI
jgi:hypothetical protein